MTRVEKLESTTAGPQKAKIPSQKMYETAGFVLSDGDGEREFSPDVYQNAENKLRGSNNSSHMFSSYYKH